MSHQHTPDDVVLTPPGPRPRRRGARGRAVALALAVLLLLLAAPAALASNSACRTDPMVWLSDGHKISITADIATGENDVQHITYTLHIPTGLTVDHIVYTMGGLGGRESVITIADQPSGRFTATTLVQAPTGDFVTTAALEVKLRGSRGADQQTGFANLPITLVVNGNQAGAAFGPRR